MTTDEQSQNISETKSIVSVTPAWIRRLPNQLTVLRIFCIPFVVVLMMAGDHYDDNITYLPKGVDYFAAIIFAVAALTDMLDGYIARKFKVETLLGKLLDPLADKLLVVSAMIILVDKHKLAGWIAVVIIVRDLGINAIRIAALEEKIIIESSWLGKTKTFFIDVAIGFLAVTGEAWGFLPCRFVGMVFVWAALFASVTSGLQYLWGYAQAQIQR